MSGDGSDDATARERAPPAGRNTRQRVRQLCAESHRGSASHDAGHTASLHRGTRRLCPGGGPSVAMRSFSFGSFFVPKPSVAPDCLRESALSSGGLTPLGEGCKPSRLCLTVVASSHVSAGPRLVLRPRVRPGPIAPGTTRPASTTPRPTSLRVGRHGRSQTIRPGGKLAPRSHLVPAERGRAAERLGP
jgi:hypothetical protein